DPPRALDGDFPVELAAGETLDDLVLKLGGRRREISGTVGSRGVVELRRDLPPRLRVRRHVVIAVAVETAGVQLRVDHLEHGNARLGVLARRDVAERTQGR